MNIVIAIDSFKGSLSSKQAGRAAAEGIRRVFTDAKTTVFPIADGGEGTVDALVCATGGVKRTIVAADPLGRRIHCEYGILPNNTAVIEMAAAAGITLLSDEERNPLYTTTYGVGEIIKDAITQGCRSYIIGIGGSATNDGGIGMLQALGFGLMDKDGRDVPLGAVGLKMLDIIQTSTALPALRECTFRIACDVTNPLCGERGCSAVFGPQKGADATMIRDMDAWLCRYAATAKEVCANADKEAAGAGAAGGIGFAFLSFLNASLVSGIELILDELPLENAIRDADLVITGEGRLDAQTVMGKAPAGVAAMAKCYRKPVIAFAGCVTDDAGECNRHGIDAFFPIVRSACTLEDAMNPDNAYRHLADTAEQAARAMRIWR